MVTSTTLAYAKGAVYLLLQPQLPSADNFLHNLVCAAQNWHDAVACVHFGDWVFEHVAVAAVKLDATVEDALGFEICRLH